MTEEKKEEKQQERSQYSAGVGIRRQKNLQEQGVNEGLQRERWPSERK